MDDEQMHRVLRLMSLPPTARNNNPVAREICVREGAAATIDGTIASLGENHIITLQANTCETPRRSPAQTQAEDKEHVLKAVGTVATAIRGKPGSLNSMQTLNSPLERATTPSLEALENYTEGYSQMEHGHFLASVPLFERARTIDPNFAMAYHYLNIALEKCRGHGAPGSMQKRLSV